ncbi:MAG: DUF362 domain-containing protein [Proteobacteria bacterium]|nr:DUF362 domain-containing protein [Pseudomonadota bacterium]
MNRRQFVRDVLLWSAGLSLGVPCFDVGGISAASAPPLLGVASGKDYSLLVEKAIEVIGGIKGFVKSGDRVVIKPNIGWDRTPELGANTHPLVVRRLAELALDAGASGIQVFDNTCNEKRRCYASSGIIDELEKIGDKRIRWEHIDPRKFVPVDISAGKSLKRWEIYQDALTADCYINVPVAKHHGLSRLSLGLKNAMGVIGGNRGKLHQNIGQDLADLATVVKPQLIVIDATRMLLRNGPQGGRVEDVKIADTVIATADPVAADAYATTLFGLRPEEIDSTVAAYKMGLGEIDLQRIQIRTVQV